MDPQHLIPGDATLIENIVNFLKAKGIFDEFRHECLADVDTKSSCQNLSQRVDGYTSKFLANETWHPDLNKNELRNKLRRHIDESGMLAVGADHVVEQVINPKIHQLFLPKIIEVVHQYVKEQTELLNKKPETVTSNDNSVSSEKLISDVPDNKDKTSVSDPIADILSFSYSKSKPISATNIHVKTENVQHKHADPPKVEKKKEEKICVVEKSSSETASENPIPSAITEVKAQDKEKEKIKKEEQETSQDTPKKAVKDDVKSEKKKTEDVKPSVSETSNSAEESKTNISTLVKPTTLSKKDIDKNKQKSKSVNTQKSPSSSSEIKKSKKEPNEKSSEKHLKSKSTKLSKESPSPSKNLSSLKNTSKEEKGESSKPKACDNVSTKTSESLIKKSKSSSNKKDSNILKHKTHDNKTDKCKNFKSVDKSEPSIHHDSSNSEKGTKSIQYSSSYDSSQGSDQERSSSKKERQKHFSKHAKKENSEHSDNNGNKTALDKKQTKDSESSSKKHKNEKDLKSKLKDTTVIEAAKISSRSNSFGSTSSVSSSSNASKDNLVSNSDEISESSVSVKDKKKKQIKEKDSCQNSSKTLPPPPPPPPPSSSLSCELTSSAELSSMEDTQSSSDSETSSSEDIEETSSDSELESKDLIMNTLNESMLNSSTDNINAFYDIFLYSSSSSEFEGYGNSPEKKKGHQDELTNVHESDISISSVHTSDLSSFDDELSGDDDVSFLTGGMKKRLTLKEAQDLIQKKASLQDKNKSPHSEDKSCTNEMSLNEKGRQKSSSFLSSDDESSPSGPKRSLRRERKLNPRYASSEYTSIFNSRKETFITKQSSPSVKNHSLNSSPNTESKYRKMDSSIEIDKLPKENSVETKTNTALQDGMKKFQKNKSHLNTESQDDHDTSSNSSEISNSNEIGTIIDNEKLFQENVSDKDELKFCLKLSRQNNSKLNRNSYSLKRKHEVTESTPVKRPCSRSSVDSSSSEFVPNENKPFNNEKQSFEEKILKDCNSKKSDLTSGMKKDLFCKQRTNNNGDILGQKDIFSKNSHSQAKTINNSDKKTSEADTSKELNSL